MLHSTKTRFTPSAIQASIATHFIKVSHFGRTDCCNLSPFFCRLKQEANCREYCQYFSFSSRWSLPSPLYCKSVITNSAHFQFATLCRLCWASKPHTKIRQNWYTIRWENFAILKTVMHFWCNLKINQFSVLFSRLFPAVLDLQDYYFRFFKVARFPKVKGLV